MLTKSSGKLFFIWISVKSASKTALRIRRAARIFSHPDKKNASALLSVHRFGDTDKLTEKKVVFQQKY